MLNILLGEQDVNTYVLTDDKFDALEMSLSPARLATYIAKTNGDRKKAVQLYTWNTAISAAFYGPLQGLEISLRNALNNQLISEYGNNWYDNPKVGLDAGAVIRIESTQNTLMKHGYPVDPPHIVADLSFGFWVSLLGTGGQLSRGSSKKANYSNTLWRPALYKAFPNGPKLARRHVHTPLNYLRTLRNRIAHHEPIFQRHLLKDYEQILKVIGWMSFEKAEWVKGHSRVLDILSMSSDDPNIRF